MYFEVWGLLEATRSVIDEARKIWQVETQTLEGQGTDNLLSGNGSGATVVGPEESGFNLKAEQPTECSESEETNRIMSVEHAVDT